MTTSTLVETKLTSMKEAVDMANQIEELEKIVKEMKGKLKTFVDANGPIETEDVIWGYSPTVSWRFDSIKELALTISREKLDCWDYLGITSANLKKLNWSEEFLSEIATKKVQERFVSRKRK